MSALNGGSLLRITVGAILLSGAVLKTIAMAQPEYAATLAWTMAGGRLGVSALVAGEAFLGALFLMGVAPRVTGITIVAVVAVFSVIVAWNGSSEPGQTCGCIGVPQMAGADDTARALFHNGCLALCALVGAYWRRPGVTAAVPPDQPAARR